MTRWAKEFGGIFSLKRFSGTIIVLSDWRYVKSLLDKRSSKYSHRPKSLVSDMITGGHHILMMEYDDSWRSVRKLIHQNLMESRCDKEHSKLQEAEANQMLYDFMTNPEENMLHPKRYSNSITMSIGEHSFSRTTRPVLTIFPVFGWRTKSPHNDYLTRLYEILEKWSMVMELGSTPPLDSFTFLKWVPELFLGKWKTRATECRDMMSRLYFEVLQCVIDRRQNGIRKGSLMDQALDAQEKYGFSDHQLAFMGGSMMEGGSDTSSSLILAIIQAMTLYPDVLKRYDFANDFHTWITNQRQGPTRDRLCCW
jgi:cytochrome P450